MAFTDEQWKEYEEADRELVRIRMDLPQVLAEEFSIPIQMFINNHLVEHREASLEDACRALLTSAINRANHYQAAMTLRVKAAQEQLDD